MEYGPNVSQGLGIVWCSVGHVFRVERVRGPVPYAKYRPPDGRRLQEKIGRAWTERGRPPPGWFTKRTAEAWLGGVLSQARRGMLPGMVRSGVTFADAAAEWLRFIEEDWERKPSTLKDYRSVLNAYPLRAFADRELETITPEPPGADPLGCSEQPVGAQGGASDPGQRRHPGVLPGGGLGARPGGGLRAGRRAVPGKVRSVPLAPDVARVLVRLGSRADWVGDDDLVFAGATGSYLDGSALRRRLKYALVRAGLRSLRFHDLRHTFGTRMIAKADIRRVQEWMGHADIQTTMRYLHYAPHVEDAALVAEAFAVSAPSDRGFPEEREAGR